jgi:hypothetical protein
MSNIAAFSPSFKNSTYGLHRMEQTVLDIGMWEALQARRVINWCVGGAVPKLYPLYTDADGNCLLHAISLGLVGSHDRELVLRDVLYRTLSGQSGLAFKERWREEEKRLHQLVGFKLDEGQWDSEWNTLVARAGTPGLSLEGVHIVVLAHLLSRPIIVYSSKVVEGVNGKVLAPEEVGGIYLPLGTEDQKCSKDFLALAYRGSHFVALVTEVQQTSADSNGLSARKIECMPIAGQDGITFDVRFHIAGHDGPVQEGLRKHLNLATPWLSDGTSCLCAERPEVLADDSSQDDDDSQFITQGLPTELCCNHEVSAESAAMSSALLTEPETLVKSAVANLEMVTSSIIQDELEHVGTGVRAWTMEGGEGEIDLGSDYVLTPPLVKEPEEMSPVVIEGLRNPESVVGEQEHDAGAAPLVEQEHSCVQEHHVVADQGVEAAKTPNDKESCVDAAKDCISAVAVAPPSKNAGPRSTRVREKRVRSAPVESDSRSLGNGDAPSDSGYGVCRPARKSWSIHLDEPVLIILAQALCSERPCLNATLDSRLLIHPIQEGKVERRESKTTTVQTKTVVAELGDGSSRRNRPDSSGWTICRAHTLRLDILSLAQVCQSPSTCIRPLTDAPIRAPLEHVSRVGVIGEPHSHKSQSKSNPGRIHRCPGREIFIFFMSLLLSVAMLPTAQAIIRVGSVTLQPSGVLEMTASWTDSPKNGTR